MAPETVTALGALGVALITAGPAYLAARARGARQEAEANREAVDITMTAAEARLHGRLDQISTQLDRIERWQVRHEVEHIAAAPYTQGDA